VAYVHGWKDPRIAMYENGKLTEYAAIPMRGWKFWRWRVVQWNNILMNSEYETVSDNLTRKQAEGLVKLMEGIRDEQS
jgi:hypothetical protein